MALPPELPEPPEPGFFPAVPEEFFFFFLAERSQSYETMRMTPTIAAP